MEMKKMVELTLVESLLGTVPGDKEIYREYIMKGAGQKEELETLSADAEEKIEKQSTYFHKAEDGKPFLYDYQIKGFFKDACGMLKRVPDTQSSKIRAHKKVIDGLIFIYPRRIPIILPEGEKIEFHERPARGQGPQGERVYLIRSEKAPEGTKLEFTIELLTDEYEDAVEEWLDYGVKRGLGQWRNSGMGRFTYREK